LDGVLILGDAVMLLATEMSSERLPLEQVGILACAFLCFPPSAAAVSAASLTWHADALLLLASGSAGSPCTAQLLCARLVRLRLPPSCLQLQNAACVCGSNLSSLTLPLIPPASDCCCAECLHGSLLHQVPALASVAIISWIAAGAILGDYAMLRDPDENPLSNAMGWPIFQAVVNSMITWAVAMVSFHSMLHALQRPTNLPSKQVCCCCRSLAYLSCIWPLTRLPCPAAAAAGVQHRGLQLAGVQLPGGA
jgi:hypothetical protein